jgi:hypothetical protein
MPLLAGPVLNSYLNLRATLAVTSLAVTSLAVTSLMMAHASAVNLCFKLMIVSLPSLQSNDQAGCSHTTPPVFTAVLCSCFRKHYPVDACPASTLYFSVWA